MNLQQWLRRARFSIFFLLPAIILPAYSATVTWTNSNGGDWSVPSNWSPNQVPGGGDNAVFSTPGSYAVTITDTEAVSNLLLGATSGTLTLTVNNEDFLFTVNGAGSDIAQSSLVVLSGSIIGTGSVVVGGPLTWTGGSIQATVQCSGGNVNVADGSVVGFGGQLINTGVMAWTPNSAKTGQGTVISNASTGTMNIALDGRDIDYYSYYGNSVFYNAGEINVSGASGGSIEDYFVNTGTVNVFSGAFGLANGGTNSGVITAASGASFAGYGNFYSTGTLSGAGNLLLGGVATLTNNINMTGALVFLSGTANVTGTTAVTGYAVTNLGATVTFNGPGYNGSGSWDPGIVAVAGGTLIATNPAGATGPVLLSGPLYWTGGNIQTSVQCNGGSVNVADGSSFTGQLINMGTMNWTPNSVHTAEGTVISNSSTGIINVALDGNDLYTPLLAGSSMFYNAGQINLSGTNQSGALDDFLFNTGTVTVSSGTFGLRLGGTNSGLISAAAGATFNPGGGTFTSSGMLSGGGNLTVSGGTANLGGQINVAGGWTFSGGIINVTGSTSAVGYAVTNNGAVQNVNFNGTGYNGTGIWQPGILAIAAGTLAGTAPMTATGPLYWSGGNIEEFVQCNGGSVNVADGSSINGQLINTGVMNWTPNSAHTAQGTVISNASDGTINVALDGNDLYSSAGGSSTFYNAGQINVFGSGQQGGIEGIFINTGTLNIQSGTLSLSPGYTLNGSLQFAISSASNFGRLVVPGDLVPNGTLRVAANAYNPATGNTFPLITYGSETGLFSALYLPPSGNWSVNYGRTAFSVSVSNTNAPAPEFQVVSPAAAPNPVFLLLGPIGSNYTIQVASNLNGNNWTTYSNFVSTASSFYFTDTTLPGYTSRLFRAFMH